MHSELKVGVCFVFIVLIYSVLLKLLEHLFSYRYVDYDGE
jgi:hypothetical protein